MIGISWRREQGLADPLLRKMLADAGLENVPQWTKEDDIPVFYFSSFDESWKVGAEGDVGAYWGIYDKEEQLKF